MASSPPSSRLCLVTLEYFLQLPPPSSHRPQQPPPPHTRPATLEVFMNGSLIDLAPLRLDLISPSARLATIEAIRTTACASIAQLRQDLDASYSVPAGTLVSDSGLATLLLPPTLAAHARSSKEQLDPTLTLPSPTSPCAICLSPIVDYFDLPCGHAFDKECITQWLGKHNSCPLDRRPVD